MVAEVCLGHVAVAAREVSRFARNSRERQKLVEVCRVVDTLLSERFCCCFIVPVCGSARLCSSLEIWICPPQ
jgi:hypothetical protein